MVFFNAILLRETKIPSRTQRSILYNTLEKYLTLASYKTTVSRKGYVFEVQWTEIKEAIDVVLIDDPYI